ncbi:hypothetical protein OG883_15835 [Streptomyces sp. NBC_01142]|uniref:hypothetical protein n=1 Tax=Streptomyces sp. NBC_01142 TaxID=2975865 RepID=UPI00225A451A|nr:hypothetical protein [Streptomyces sp. NBC_01142]MCX4821350.1 hypothetical protein [Streptomyces sp. NBC_01142]
MKHAAQGEPVTVSEPPGPITKAIISALWRRTFNSDPANPMYLPRIIRDGYPEWGLPSYDPAVPGGTSAPIDIPNVPDGVGDAACARYDLPYPPICTTPPALQLTNIVFTNLSVMQDVSLTFSTTEPVFTAVVSVGTVTQPFTLDADDPSQPNYLFQIGCCEPVTPDSRDCGEQRWTTDAGGRFVARAHDAILTFIVRLNTSEPGPMTINVLGVGLTVDSKAVTIDFDVEGEPRWVQQLAEIAVNEGVGNGGLVDGMRTFLNQPDVIENIETFANEALKNILAEMPYA